MKQFYLYAALFLFTLTSQAQVIGTTSSVSENFDYQENMTNVELDPSPMVGAASELSFSHTFSSTGQQPPIGLNDAVNILGDELGINIPGWLTELAGGFNPFCFDVDAYARMGASIDVGGYYLVREVGNSNIDIDYPVEVTITYPAQNTFGCGYEVRIDTQYEVLEPNKTDKLKVTPPFINQEVGPTIDNLNFFAEIGLEAWVGIGINNPIPGLPDLCQETNRFNESYRWELGGPALPTLPALINVCEDAYGPNATEATLLGCGVLSPATPILNIAQIVLDNYNAQNGTNFGIASFPNENTVIVETNFPEGGPTLPEMSGTFKNTKNTDLGFQSLDQGKRLVVSGTKTELSKMRFDLVSLIDYFGYPTSLDVGLVSLDVGDIAPTITVDQEMNFEFKPVVNLNLDLGQSMVYNVYNADDTLSHSGNGQIVALVAGQYILADFPSDLSDPLDVTGTTFLDGEFKTLSKQIYSDFINVTFAEVEIPGVFNEALVDEDTEKEQFGQNTILDHTFNLQPINVISLPGFQLDPEDPVVTVSSLTLEDIINLGGGERAVVYKIGVRNDGDVLLSNVRLNFDLDRWFNSAQSYKVECVSSDYFDVALNYDGNTIINLLAENNTIEIGDNQFIEILVRVKPEISEIIADGCFGTVEYNVSTTAFATSPIGTEVESNYNQCTEMTIAPDIIELVDLGASVISDINDFTVYSTKTLTFSKEQQISKGNAGSQGTVRFENVSMQNGPEAIIVGDLHSGDLINVIGHSAVIVDYVQTSAEINLIGNNSSFEVTGNISEYSNCASLPDIPSFISSVNHSDIDIVVGNNETVVLPPGDYKSVSLNRNSTLVMQSGRYDIKDWHFKKHNATVQYDLSGAPITIHLQKWHANKNNLQFVTIGSSSTRDVYYYVLGNGTTSFNNSLVQGNIKAPLGTISFDKASTLEGTCYAETIKFRNGSGYAGHKFLEPLNISEECQGAVVYRTSDETGTGNEKTGTSGAEENTFGDIKLTASPNPMVFQTTISFDLDKSYQGKLILQDFNGKTIQVLSQKRFDSGIHQVTLNASQLRQGMYFYSFVTDQGTVTKKLIKV